MTLRSIPSPYHVDTDSNFTATSRHFVSSGFGILGADPLWSSPKLSIPGLCAPETVLVCWELKSSNQSSINSRLCRLYMARELAQSFLISHSTSASHDITVQVNPDAVVEYCRNGWFRIEKTVLDHWGLDVGYCHRLDIWNEERGRGDQGKTPSRRIPRWRVGRLVYRVGRGSIHFLVL